MRCIKTRLRRLVISGQKRSTPGGIVEIEITLLRESTERMQIAPYNRQRESRVRFNVGRLLQCRKPDVGNFQRCRGTFRVQHGRPDRIDQAPALKFRGDLFENLRIERIQQAKVVVTLCGIIELQPKRLQITAIKRYPRVTSSHSQIRSTPGTGVVFLPLRVGDLSNSVKGTGVNRPLDSKVPQ